MKLRALKTFSAGGAHLVFEGNEFEASKAHAEEYVRLGLAEALSDTGEPTNTFQEPPITEDTARTDYTEAELLEKNMTDLKKIAKNIGVTGYSQYTKSEIIFAILAQQNTNKAKWEAQQNG